MNVNAQLGTLNVTIPAKSFEEACEIQSSLDEFQTAVNRLAGIAGVETSAVKIVYRKDIQGSTGTFNKITLRVNKDGKSFSIDFGNTDKNPLGVYIKSNGPIDVYDYNTKQRSQIGGENGQQAGGFNGGGQQFAPSRPAMPSQPMQAQPQQPMQPAAQPQAAPAMAAPAMGGMDNYAWQPQN